jgi:hypothetical protein
MTTDPLHLLLAALKLTDVDDDRYEGQIVERERPRVFV